MKRTLTLCGLAFLGGAFVATVAVGAAQLGRAIGQAAAEFVL